MNFWHSRSSSDPNRHQQHYHINPKFTGVDESLLSDSTLICHSIEGKLCRQIRLILLYYHKILSSTAVLFSRVSFLEIKNLHHSISRLKVAWPRRWIDPFQIFVSNTRRNRVSFHFTSPFEFSHYNILQLNILPLFIAEFLRRTMRESKEYVDNDKIRLGHFVLHQTSNKPIDCFCFLVQKRIYLNPNFIT
jgi:hypothetical protein